MRLTKTVIISSKGYQKLPQKLLLKNGLVIDTTENSKTEKDILIEDGMITGTGSIDSSGFDGEVLDLKGKYVSPGWMDMHAHLREPGREDEETIESGSLAAANGGFTAVCCMPNTEPPIDSQEIIQYILDRAMNTLVSVHPIAAITKKREGEELADMLELIEQGAVAISDDGSPVMSAEIMRRALEYSRMIDIPVIGHEEDRSMTQNGQMHEGLMSTRLGLGGIPSVAEEIMIARDIMLADYTGGRFHVAHISTKGSVELVRQARKRGIKVSAEATPHHFSLTDDAVREFNTNTKMHPPLRTEDDRKAIIEGLRDGTIEVIATDHAPHASEEKEAEFIHAPFGIIGFETAFGLAMTNLVHTGVIDIFELIRKFVDNPYKILGLETPSIQKGVKANLTIFEPDAQWSVDAARSLSKCTNSPFFGYKFKGKPFATINNNQIFYSIL